MSDRAGRGGSLSLSLTGGERADGESPPVSPAKRGRPAAFPQGEGGSGGGRRGGRFHPLCPLQGRQRPPPAPRRLPLPPGGRPAAARSGVPAPSAEVFGEQNKPQAVA